MKKRSQKWFFAFIWILMTLALGSCSDEGNVRYADDAFIRELCGLPPVTEESATEPEETGEATQETAESTSEPRETTESTSETRETIESTAETEDPSESTVETAEPSESTSETEVTSESASQESTAIPEIEKTPGDLELKNLIIGSWRSEPISVEAMVKEAVQGESWLVPYLTLDPEKLTVHVTMDFADDGKATLNVEEKSYQDLMAYIKGAVSDGVLKYFESYVKALGLKLSVKQYLKMAGISIDSYVADVIEKSAGDLSIESMRYQCLFDVLDGKLCVSETAMGIYLRECYFEIKISDSQLELLQYFENGKEGNRPLGLDVKLPILLHKVPTWKGNN